MTPKVRILSTKKLHVFVQDVLITSNCETLEQYGARRGIEAAAKLATFSRALSLQDTGKWSPPWCKQEDYRSTQSPLHHWWIDCLSFFEEVTGVDYEEVGDHWEEVVDFVRQLPG